MTRLQQLQERIEEPFLVTTPANVRYLTGFDSTNSALLVEPVGAGAGTLSVTGSATMPGGAAAALQFLSASITVR